MAFGRTLGFELLELTREQVEGDLRRSEMDALHRCRLDHADDGMASRQLDGRALDTDRLAGLEEVIPPLG